MRARPPYTLSPSQPSRAGAIGTRPRLDFIPTSPQHAAGIRIEPPPSEPVAIGTRPAATAAADPPEEPPGVRLGSHGLRVTPLAAVAVQGKIVSSGTLVIPIGIAPAARRRRTTSLSAVSGAPKLREPRDTDCPATGQVVLDGDRDAGQQALVPLALLRLGQRLLGHDHPERVQTRVERFDASQAEFDELAWMHLAGADQGGQRPGTGKGQLFVLGRAHGLTLASGCAGAQAATVQLRARTSSATAPG